MKGEVPMRVGVCLACLIGVFPVAAQEILDRVLARVGNVPITLTDVRAARALGIVEAPAGAAGDSQALTRMIDRRLMLVELTRFPRPEPDAGLVDAELAAMTAAAGARLPEILEVNGLDERRFRALARDTVAIRAYLDERFPPSPVSDADTLEYYQQHRDEFTRDGVLMTFEEAEPQARAAVAEAARRSNIARWLQNLRARIEVVILRTG
jgi:hypothetical protein